MFERLNRYEKYRGMEMRLSDIVEAQVKEIAEHIDKGTCFVLMLLNGDVNMRARKTFCVVAYDIVDNKRRERFLIFLRGMVSG